MTDTTQVTPAQKTARWKISKGYPFAGQCFSGDVLEEHEDYWLVRTVDGQYRVSIDEVDYFSTSPKASNGATVS